MRSYVCPSAATTGSKNRSCVIGHLKASGVAATLSSKPPSSSVRHHIMTCVWMSERWHEENGVIKMCRCATCCATASFALQGALLCLEGGHETNEILLQPPQTLETQESHTRHQRLRNEGGAQTISSAVSFTLPYLTGPHVKPSPLQGVR